MTTNSKPLKGLVATILNSREVAITIGRDHGVTHGMLFSVLSGVPLEVKDPQSGEVLDTVDREKIRVRAIEVRPKITVCATYRIVSKPGGSLYPGSLSRINELMSPPKRVVETLRIDDASTPEPLPESESYVKIGDRVIQIEDSKTADGPG